ncbi:MAG: dipeptidase [Phycisphaerales bacterium]|nr:MAG: dipeptidase [Phycisphaerales bacterium]
MIDQVVSYVEAHREEYVGRLSDFLRIESVSTDRGNSQEMRRAAQWVCNLMAEAGIQAETMDTGGWPCVVADSGPVAGDAPTILVYGHYDVQPVGDLSLWESGPFEPAIRGGRMYARGSADDKGQLLTHLLAVEAWNRTAGKLPVRVKFIIEGEEEVGSPNLVPFITRYREKLACDYVVISDTTKFDGDTPAITYGTRGLVYKEITLTGPRNDTHSGSFGGTVANPCNVLADVIAGLKDADNRITIPGFYDRVLELSPAERRELEKLPFDERAYLTSVGSPALDGETALPTLVRRWARPTLDVNGLFGGFSGEGPSTIIPARCGAKVSMRIVPDQDPHEISQAFDKAVQAMTPPTVRLSIKTFADARPYLCPIDSRGMNAAVQAVEAGFRIRPVFIREGGTLPILPEFRRILGADSIMMGFCLPDCNLHGPNEFLVLEDFWAGIRTAAFLQDRMADLGPA